MRSHSEQICSVNRPIEQSEATERTLQSLQLVPIYRLYGVHVIWGFGY